MSVRQQFLCRRRIPSRRPICTVVREVCHSDRRENRDADTTDGKASGLESQHWLINKKKSGIRYWEAVAIAQVAGLSVISENRFRDYRSSKKVQYGGR